MKTHTNNFKEQIKKFGRQIDSKITFGSTVLGKNDLNAVTPSYQGAILKSVMKQLDIDSNVAIPIGTILKYEFGLKVNGQYEYINYGNYVVYSIEKQEDTGSYKIVCYDKLLYSMLDYVKLPITYPISIRDYINSISTVLGLKFANKSETFANYDKQIQADLYEGLGYTFRDVLDELAQVTASTICLNENDELEIRYITETNDVIDEEYLKDVNVNFGEKFGAVNTIVLSRSADSDSVYYPPTLPANPYEIKISDNQIMNGNDRADFLPDIYNKLNGLEFYTNDFVSTGICYYDLCDRYSVKVGDTTYSCIMFNDEVLVTQGLVENIYTELPEQTETDYKHASKDDRMINQVYIIAKKNEAEILAVVNTTKEIQKEINPTKDESGSEIIIDDASNNPLTYLEIEGKSIQETRSGKNLLNVPKNYSVTLRDVIEMNLSVGTYKLSFESYNSNGESNAFLIQFHNSTTSVSKYFYFTSKETTFELEQDYTSITIYSQSAYSNSVDITTTFNNLMISVEGGEYEEYGISPSPDYASEIESVGYENLFDNIFRQGDAGSTGVTNRIYSQNDILVKENKTYTVTTNLDISIYRFAVNISQQPHPNYSQAYDSGWQRIHSFTFNSTINGYLGVIVSKQDNSAITREQLKDAWFIISKGTQPHSYIPQGKYGIEVKTTNGVETNTSLIVLNEPLRSLPNGVKDIAYIKNNKLYVDRYINSIILDGSESWSKYGADGTINQLRTIIKDKPKYFTSNIVDNNSLMCSHFTSTIYKNYWTKNNSILFALQDSLFIQVEQTVDEFKTWLSTHNTQVDYELAEPYTEELGEIEMLKTLKGYNTISTTDNLLPVINLTYVRDTIIADYVENHVTELKLTENEIKASVENVSSSVDGLNTTINRVEEITNDNSQVINIISTNIDQTTGEVREVTTTTGFTFNADGMTIDDGSGFKAQHRASGTYYKDGESITGQYTKDGSKQKDLELFGTYSYGKESIDDTPMFVGQLYTDENGEECFGHFANM